MSTCYIRGLKLSTSLEQSHIHLYIIKHTNYFKQTADVEQIILVMKQTAANIELSCRVSSNEWH